MNNPKQTMARLMHKNYFDIIAPSEMEREWLKKIAEHVKNCRHPLCMELKETG